MILNSFERERKDELSEDNISESAAAVVLDDPVQGIFFYFLILFLLTVLGEACLKKGSLINKTFAKKKKEVKMEYEAELGLEMSWELDFMVTKIES